MSKAPREEKICASCGRPFSWRRKWARVWDEVKYCSERCKHNRHGGQDDPLEAAILKLLETRAAGSTICPSEAARAVYGEDWRTQMETTREAARRLAHAGRIEITQRGKTVDTLNFRGPIRLRLRT